MFTSNQQRCLHELGIQPLALRQRIEKSDDAPQASRVEDVTVSRDLVAKDAGDRPSLSSLLKSSAVNEADTTKAELARVTKSQPVFDWSTDAAQATADISVLFPQLVVRGRELHLGDDWVWRIEPDCNRLMLEGKVIISPEFRTLNHTQRKQVWLWLSQ